MLENCVPWTDSRLQQADIVLNAYFFLMWFMRFLHFDDVPYYLLHPYSFVFFMTVPPSFLSIALGRSWSGMLGGVGMDYGDAGHRDGARRGRGESSLGEPCKIGDVATAHKQVKETNPNGMRTTL